MNGFIPLLIVAAIGFLAGAAAAYLVCSLTARNPAPLQKGQGLLFSRDRNGRLWVETGGGKPVAAGGDLTGGQRRELQTLLEDLNAWVGKPVSIARSSSVESFGLVPPAASAVEPAEMRSSRPVTPGLGAPAVQPAPNPPVHQTIADQIDAILQEKLSVSPLKDRGIRLMELPGKGLVVLVGLDQYDGVDAVPDPDVRRMIRESVSAWECKHELQ